MLSCKDQVDIERLLSVWWVVQHAVRGGPPNSQIVQVYQCCRSIAVNESPYLNLKVWGINNSDDLDLALQARLETRILERQ